MVRDKSEFNRTAQAPQQTNGNSEDAGGIPKDRLSSALRVCTYVCACLLIAASANSTCMDGTCESLTMLPSEIGQFTNSTFLNTGPLNTLLDTGPLDTLLNTGPLNTFGWAGDNNTAYTSIDACDSVDCGGASTCSNGPNKFTCSACDPGSTGGGDNTVCTDVDECDGVDCGGGSTCSNGPNKFTCSACDPGFTGGGDNTVCTDVDECHWRVCGGGSTCINGPNKFTCSACDPGWTGGGDNTVCTLSKDSGNTAVIVVIQFMVWLAQLWWYEILAFRL